MEDSPDMSYMERDEYAPTNFGDIGLYMKNKRIKTQFQHEELRRLEGRDSYPQIFAGIKVHINGQTDTPSAQLNSMLILHGAVVYPVLDRKAQIAHNGFIIAATLTPTKRIDFKAYKVVTEYWILDSIKQGKLLDWREYAYAATDETEQQDASQYVGQMPGGAAVPQKTLVDSFKRPLRTLKPPPKTKTDDKVEERPQSDDFNGYAAYLPSKPNHRAAELLQDDDWRLKHTAVAPDFIEGYYRQSRLHHLSAWKADLPAMVARSIAELIQEERLPSDHKIGAESSNKRLTGTATDGRTIFHCDFDCFFSSASLIAQPELKGKPVAVCHAREGSDGSTSEIASCSYEARAFGVKNGISLGRAREMCPDIQTVPYDFALYEKISAIFYKILLSRADNLQAVSCDECYIEVTNKVKAGQEPLQIAESIRDEVRLATGCEISIGISHNMVLARLATTRAKPASAFYLTPDHIAEFLAPLGVSDLPSFGGSAYTRLQARGIETLAQVQAAGRGKLQDILGANQGIKLHDFSKGIDPRALEPPGIRKSVSVELNYAIRFVNNEEVQTFLHGLSGELVKRMVALPVTGRHLTLKVMRRAKDADVETPKFLGHGRCDTIAAVHDFANATSDQAEITEVAIRLIQRMQIPPEDLRGIALQMQKLSGNALGEVNQPKLSFSKPAFQPEMAAAPLVQKVSKKDEDVVALPISTRRPLTRASSALAVAEQKETSNELEPRAKTPAIVEKAAKAKSAKAAAPSIMLAFQPTKKRDTKGKGKEILQTKIGTQGSVKVDRPHRRLLNVDTVTDADLKEYGIDPDYFRSIGRVDRMESLTYVMEQRRVHDVAIAQKKFVERARGIVLDTSTSVVLNDAEDKLNAPIPQEPLFRGLASIDEIRPKIEGWVMAHRQGPAPKDAQKLEAYLLANLQAASLTNRGPNLERVTQIIEWLHYCVVRHAGDLAKGKSVISWREFFDVLLATINARVVELRGRKLYLNLV